MKRILLFSFALVLSVYLMPFLAVKGDSDIPPDSLFTTGVIEGIISDELPTEEMRIADSQKTVSVLIDGEVKNLKLNDYLCGVLTAEMPASFPEEALKAQVVAARTYIMYKERLLELGAKPAESHKGALMCDDYRHCKAYIDMNTLADELWGKQADLYSQKIKDAVLETDGEILIYDNEPIAAVFHSTSGPRTEASKDIWGNDMPYLQSVESPGGESSPHYKQDVTFTAEEFRDKFLKVYPEADLSLPPVNWFKASTRSEGGSILEVSVGGVRVTGQKIREIFALGSANFTITPTDDTLTFHTVGYGHGVGLSQYGAKALAEEGKNYIDILKWYYSGVEVSKMKV